MSVDEKNDIKYKKWKIAWLKVNIWFHKSWTKLRFLFKKDAIYRQSYYIMYDKRKAAFEIICIILTKKMITDLEEYESQYLDTMERAATYAIGNLVNKVFEKQFDLKVNIIPSKKKKMKR